MTNNEQPDQPSGQTNQTGQTDQPASGGSYTGPQQPQPYSGPQAPYPGQQPPAQPYPGAPPYPGQQAYPGQPSYGPPQPYPGAPQYPGQQQYPGQPQQYPGPPQQYPGPQQPGQQPPYPGQPPYGSPPRQGRSRAPLFIALGALVLILALVAVFALTWGNHDVGGTVPTLAPTTGTSTAGPAPQAADASAAVQDYLTAVSGGDATTALAYAASPPADAALLTDDMLAASLAAAPITGIVVTPGTGADHQSVQADYLIGGESVSTTFEVTNVGGSWLLDDVAFELPLDLSALDGLDLTINGLPLDATAVPLVFPGQYTVRTDSAWYKTSGGTALVDGGAGGASAVSLRLSSSGVSAIRNAAQAKLDACVQKRSLAPSGCGFGVHLPAGNTVRTSTIRWQVISGSNAMKKLKPSLLGADMATATTSVRLRNDCSSTNGKRWYGFSSIHSVYITLGSSKVKISFGY